MNECKAENWVLGAAAVRTCTGAAHAVIRTRQKIGEAFMLTMVKGFDH
jgi:hypothetical protein